MCILGIKLANVTVCLDRPVWEDESPLVVQDGGHRSRSLGSSGSCVLAIIYIAWHDRVRMSYCKCLCRRGVIFLSALNLYDTA